MAEFNGIRAIVTDIEGTTSSISFVHEVLFPYAAKHMDAFIRENFSAPAVAEQLDEVARLGGVDRKSPDALIKQLLDWIAEDKKITPLKALQGMIWRAGYDEGAYKGHVYPEVAERLRHWRELGIRLFVYSSGSVAAQKQIFGFSEAGDLTPLFSGYFDTRVGGKREADSYRAIVREVSEPASSVLFLSDVPAELSAAAEAELQVCQLVRGEGIERQEAYPAVASFADLVIKPA
ncbi:acireductone synthase [Hahella sp. HN01]|uniref:acireductone synthase n=1 Tax=Hahella sp. HN01 TaxID=2847262 RepID=UPI001C1EF359|nr:acireductone synthase [Hahella sp. HN01]MBU6953685.1 acireductone synthase [Hahella sp. HN01]